MRGTSCARESRSSRGFFSQDTNMKNRVAIFLVLAVTMALGALAFRSRAGTARKSTEDASRIFALERELRNTNQRLEGLSQQQAILTMGASALSDQLREVDAHPDRQLNSPSESTSPQQPSPDAVDDGDSARRAIEERKSNERLNRLRDELQNQPRDASWANQVEDSYRAQVENANAPDGNHAAKVVALECRTDLCRMEVEFSSADAESHFHNFRHDPSIHRGTVHRFTEDGHPRLVMFMARGDRSIRPLQESNDE
jgi:hypothetical protein